MKTSILSMCLTLLCAMANAQNKPATLDVNGLVLGEQYTDAQIRAVLGEPFFFKQYESDSGGDARRYMFGTAEKYDTISYNEDYGGVNEINIERSEFGLFDGKIHIGDNISKMKSIGFILEKQLALKSNNIKYLIDPQSDGYYLVLETDKNGNIVWIYLSIRL